MPYIRVDTNKLKNYSSEIASLESRVRNIKQEFSSTANALDWEIKSASNIRSKTDKITRELGTEVSSLNKMENFLSNTARKYAELDGSKINAQAVLSIHDPVTVGSVTTTSQKVSSSPWKTISKFIGKMGFVGNVISGVMKIPVAFDAGSSAKTVVDVAKGMKDGVKGLFDWHKAVSNTKFYTKLQPGKAATANKNLWKSAFGLNDVFKGKASKFKGSWTTRFSRNFNKNMNTQVGKYTKGGATSAFAWIGVGLNFLGNAVSNQDEYKSGQISKQRAVAETITETVVDTATGMLVGAGVAAGLAATIGSAPVLAVGAATVGITMGLDFACKKITGAITGTEKGLTETVSDLALDIGAGISKGAKNLVSGAGKLLGKLFGK